MMSQIVDVKMDIMMMILFIANLVIINVLLAKPQLLIV